MSLLTPACREKLRALRLRVLAPRWMLLARIHHQAQLMRTLTRERDDLKRNLDELLLATLYGQYHEALRHGCRGSEMEWRMHPKWEMILSRSTLADGHPVMSADFVKSPSSPWILGMTVRVGSNFKTPDLR